VIGRSYPRTRGPAPELEFDGRPTLSLVHAVGEEFVLQYAAWARAFWSEGGYCAIDGRLTFEGLAPEYRVTSCRQYMDVPVAVEALDWGAVKQLYRQ
jgi:hypothetical protein